MSAPGGRGGSAATHMLCALFNANPELNFEDIHIHHGRVEVDVVGERGALKAWCRAVPQHSMRTALVTTFYGLAEADVLEQDGIVVTIRRPLVGPGGQS